MSSKTLRASLVIGGALAGSFRTAIGGAENGLNSIGAAVASVERRQRLLSQSINTFGRMGRNVDGLREEYARLTRQAERLRGVYASLQRIEAAREANIARRGEMRGQLFDAVAMGAMVAAPVKAAIDFESAMADVNKVVDFEGSAFTLESMGRNIRDMSGRLPMAAKDIAAIVAAGGQSGLAADDLTAFAESAVKVGVAFGMTADDAGQMMAEFRSAFKMSQGEVNTLTDRINLLANTTAASESKIAAVVGRVGPLGEVAGMAAAEIAAMGATLVSMGVAEEVSATGIQNLMLGMVAGTGATKRQAAAFRSLGMDAEQVAKDMQTDATGAIMTVLRRVATLDEHVRATTLRDLFGTESIKAIAPMLNNMDALADNFTKVGDAQRYAGAVDREYAARSATTANNLQLFRNRVANIGIVMGSVLLPPLNAFLDRIGPMISGVANFAEANPGATRAIIGTASALVGLKIAAIAGGYAWTFIRGPMLSVMGIIQRFRAGTLITSMARTGRVGLTIAKVFRAVGAVIAGIGGGPIAVAVAALTVGALVVRKYWQPIAAFFRGAIGGAVEALRPSVAGLIDAFKPMAPLWHQAVGAFKSAWAWLSQLLAPVESTSEELAGAGEAGRMFGRLVVTNVRLVIGVVTAAVRVVGYMANAWNGMRIAAGRAIDWVMGKLSPLRDAMAAVGSAFGFGDEGRAPAAAGRAGPPATIPRVPTAAGRGGAVAPSQTTINVTQLPGESGEALARRIATEQERRAGVRERGKLED